jgi:hypothetical protein
MKKQFLIGTVAGALTILAVTVNAAEGARTGAGASEADVATSALTRQLNHMGLEVLGASQPDSGQLEDLILVVRPNAPAFRDGRSRGDWRADDGDDDDNDGGYRKDHRRDRF